jgi:hypothetical protein
VINFTPVNEEASGPTITALAEEVGKPIICESSPTDGCTTLVSIDDYAAGFKVGVWAASTPATTSAARPTRSTSGCRR